MRFLLDLLDGGVGLRFTQIVGELAGVTLPLSLRRPVFGAIAAHLGMDLSEAELPIDAYPSFDDLFTRRLAVGARPWKPAPEEYGSPADGRLDAAGRAAGARALQAKGIEYRLEALTGLRKDEPTFEDALYATIYLSPKDYHRVHVPTMCQFGSLCRIGSSLLPVNELSAPYVDGLFVRNERVVARFHDAEGRRGAVVLVGATAVAKISVEFDVDLPVDHRVAGPVEARLPDGAARDAGDELGAFHLGSTVVVVVGDPDHTLRLAPNLQPGASIRVGEPLFVRDA